MIIYLILFGSLIVAALIVGILRSHAFHKKPVVTGTLSLTMVIATGAAIYWALANAGGPPPPSSVTEKASLSEIERAAAESRDQVLKPVLPPEITKKAREAYYENQRQGEEAKERFKALAPVDPLPPLLDPDSEVGTEKAEAELEDWLGGEIRRLEEKPPKTSPGGEIADELGEKLLSK